MPPGFGEPTFPGGGGGCGGVDEGAGPAGGDGAVAGEPGRLGVGLEEGAVGDDELDFDPGDPAGGAGGAFDQGVGHQLAAAPGVAAGAAGFGVPGQRGVHGHALRDGEQGGELAHGVRGRAEADVPVVFGVRGTGGDGAGVQPVGGGAGRAGDGPVPGAGEGAGVGGEVFIDGGPVRGAQAGGLADQQGGAPFVELPALQRGQSVGHFGHERSRQAQEPAAFGGGFAPGQGDLRAGPGAELLGGDPGGGLLAALEQVEGHGETCLLGGQGGFQVFQFPDLVDNPGSFRGGAAGVAAGPVNGYRIGGGTALRGWPGGQAAGPVSGRRIGGGTALRGWRGGLAAGPVSGGCIRAMALSGAAIAGAAPGAAEASVAVCCRNHFGLLVAVHEPSLPWGSDI